MVCPVSGFEFKLRDHRMGAELSTYHLWGYTPLRSVRLQAIQGVDRP